MKIKHILIGVIVALMLTSCSDIEPERKWQECDREMKGFFTEFLKLEYPNLSWYGFPCSQAYALTDKSSGALECQFDISKLDTVCKPDRWYVATPYIRIEYHPKNLYYFKRVNPCTGPSGEIQGCSAPQYFVELDTW